MKKTLTVILSSVCAAAMLFGCSDQSAYDNYSKAYQAMAAPASMDADFTLELDTDTEDVTANGNMKLDLNANNLYFTMDLNGTQATQYLKDGILYTDINGQKTVMDTRSQNKEVPSRIEGNEETGAGRTEGTSFDLNSFLDELATMLEATKIKEMGLLDPIPQNVISEITQSDDDNGGKTYEIELSSTMIKKIFNTMIAEQVSDEAYSLSFSDLKDFECTMHENSAGVLDAMTYGGNTVVTVPAALNNGTEMDIPMEITIDISLNNPGTAVVIPEFDTTGF